MLSNKLILCFTTLTSLCSPCLAAGNAAADVKSAAAHDEREVLSHGYNQFDSFWPKRVIDLENRLAAVGAAVNRTVVEIAQNQHLLQLLNELEYPEQRMLPELNKIVAQYVSNSAYPNTPESILRTLVDTPILIDNMEHWFLSLCETTEVGSHLAVAEMLRIFPGRHAEYISFLRERGVFWPYSPSILKLCKDDGFVYKPTFLELDRMKCPRCKVVVVGIAFINGSISGAHWMMCSRYVDCHDWSKHVDATGKLNDADQKLMAAALLPDVSSQALPIESLSSPTAILRRVFAFAHHTKNDVPIAADRTNPQFLVRKWLVLQALIRKMNGYQHIAEYILWGQDNYQKRRAPWLKKQTTDCLNKKSCGVTAAF